MQARSIALSGDGSRLVFRSTNGLNLLRSTGSDDAVVIPVSSILDFAVVGSEVWVVDQDRQHPLLRRFTFDGESVGEPEPLARALDPARLIVAPCGACAIWTAAPLAMVGLADKASCRISGDPDFVLPISPTRWVACQRWRVALREATVERWRSDAIIEKGRQAIDGAVLFDASGAALVTASTSGTSAVQTMRQLVVFGLREPVVQHRFTLAGAGAVRFARGRGFGLALIGRRRLVLLDLRFGSVVADHTLDHDILDLAIDDAGQQIALQRGDGLNDVVLLPVRELVAAAAFSPYNCTDPERFIESSDGATGKDASATNHAVAAPRALGSDPAISLRAADIANEPNDKSASSDILAVSLHSVVALAPRARVELTTPEEARSLLDMYRELVGALTERAIALAWDEGRLTLVEGQHPPFRSEVRGIRGRTRGLTGADLDEATQAVATAMRQLAAVEASLSGRVSPLGLLAAEHGLSKTAYKILLVVAAPMLWGQLARLYAILRNDVSRPLCDEMLITSVLGPQTAPYDIARELDADRPLLRHGILRVGTGMRPFAALTVEPVVLQLLRGVYVPAAVRDVRVIDATVRFEDLHIPAAVKMQIAAAMATPPLVAPRLVVRGRNASGRHTLLAALAAASGRRLGVIDAAPLVRDLVGRSEELQQSIQRAHLLGLLPCIDGLETIASDDPVTRDRLRELFREHPGPLAIRLPRDVHPPLDPGYIAIDLPPLSIGERLAAWNSALDAHGLSVRDPLDLATRYSAGPGAITRVCRSVANRHTNMVAHSGTSESTDDASMQIEATLRQHIEVRLGATATRVERLATWSQVILPSDIQDSLTELIARFKHRRMVYESWHFDRVVTTSRGVVALFAGGPGTGKTMVAGAIANDLGVDLYRVDLSRIMSKWIGETEQNLAKLFDAAEDAHAIILFDEADSLFAKRTKVQTSVDRYANLEVNYLLQRLDSFEGIAILTTNFGSAIDRAFSRRLTVRITFPFPDEEMREKLWKAHLPKEVPTAGPIDFGALARRFKLSGGYIRNAALRAAFLAAEEHTPLTQEHLERAIRAEFREIGQLSDSSVLE